VLAAADAVASSHEVLLLLHAMVLHAMVLHAMVLHAMVLHAMVLLLLHAMHTRTAQ